MAAGYDLLYRLGKDYEKPEFGIKTVKVGRRRRRDPRKRRDRQALLPVAPLQALHRRAAHPADAEEPARGADRGAAVGPLRHAAARHRAHHAAGPQGLHHRLDRTRAWCRCPRASSTWTTTSTTSQDFIRHLQAEYGNCHVISVCQPTVPVLAAVSLMASRGETDAAVDDHDGRPDRCAQVADRGQQPGDEQELRVVREQRDLPRAARLPGRRPPRVSRASCSTPASSR